MLDGHYFVQDATLLLVVLPIGFYWEIEKSKISVLSGVLGNFWGDNPMVIIDGSERVV